MGYNRLIVMGNLTRDPETRAAGSSTVCAFGVAENRKYRTAAGEEREDVLFIDCEAWGKTGELIQQYFGKGKPIHVEGRLKLDQWDDKQTGEKRSKHKMTVESFAFCGGRGGDDGGDDKPTQRAPAKAATSKPSKPAPPKHTATEEDIPF